MIYNTDMLQSTFNLNIRLGNQSNQHYGVNYIIHYTYFELSEKRVPID